MADSIENGATIRIGLQNKEVRLETDPRYFAIPTHSIKINKKTEYISKGPGTHKKYLEACKKNAEKIAEIMVKKNVKKYVIFNGERVRYSNKKWESCDYMPADGVQLFRKTLEEKLKERAENTSN